MYHARPLAMIPIVVLIMLRLPAAAAAQPPGTSSLPHVELWGGWALAMPVSNGTLDVSYAPPLRLGGTPLESRASQTLNVETGAGSGVDLGANIFFSRVFGVQGAFMASSAEVSGTNGEFHKYLRYISLPPPNYQPTENTLDVATPWDPTTGTLGYRSVAIGGVVRWRAAAGRVGGSVAGGIDVGWFTGKIESVGYTQFVLGGHSTLFSTMHRVRVGPSGGERSYAPYVGADAHVNIAPRIAAMGGFRVRLASSRSVPIEVIELVDPNEDTWTPELSDVAAALAGQSLDLPGTRWHAFVGVKLFLF